ncbi:MAG: DMT family transporter [Balneolaceae bacterium]|nr:DMT family transporter [Balneolaceae bacterium]MBO6546232.1 DMT family transporter [Balneolaceae bacterium]MBO6648591.1 DMT family transporter [Balneolaceae bacterium]
MGILYISLSVGCSLTIAHFLKVAEQSKSRVLNVLCINYLVAACISFFITDDPLVNVPELPPQVLILAIFLGVVFIANLFLYSASLNKIGMGISIAAMRMSLVIPIAVSIFIYGESIAGIKYFGIVLVFISLYLLLPKLKVNQSKVSVDFIFPILLFVMTGIADTSLKVFESEFAGILSEYTFLGMIFFSSFVLGMMVLAYKKELSFSRKEILNGIIIGVANLYSSFFLILALHEIFGSLVFSITNVANVILGALIGFVVWKDKLSTKQKAGLILALTSILILI